MMTGCSLLSAKTLSDSGERQGDGGGRSCLEPKVGKTQVQTWEARTRPGDEAGAGVSAARGQGPCSDALLRGPLPGLRVP